MDFNLILLLVGLGLLGIVVLFALWGFLGGLKRELSCIAVFLVLLVLAWLVFGNSGVLLNYSGSGVDSLRNMFNLPAKDATIWDTIVDYLKSIDGLNMDVLLVEGKETYNLVYSIASCVATFILLIACTLVVVIITPIIRLISHIVMLIVNGAKKRKAQKQPVNAEAEPSEKTKDEEADDAVLVLKGVEGADDAVVTVSENELPEKKKTKKRAWGAVAGALKGVFLIILLFAPISGIYAILRTASLETRTSISNLVNGSSTQVKVDSSTDPVDMAFDFVDAYGSSAIGKFVEGSSYFFGQSFSTLLFDSMSKINTSNQTIKLREELIVYLEVINQLGGNFEIGTWTDEEVSEALEILKDSKLLPEIMPVGIEFVSEIEFVKEALAKAVQTAPFLSLRDIDWDQDVEIILDALKEAYKLDIFPLSDFNYLTMDSKILANVVEILGNAEIVNKVLPIIVKTGVKLDALENLIGQVNKKLAIDSVNWKNELLKIVDIYAEFQKYGYTSLEQITNQNKEELANSFIVDNFATTVNIFDKVVDLVLYGSVVVPVAQVAIDNFFMDETNGFTEFANIINLNEITTEMWKEDFHSILTAAKLAVRDLNAISLKLDQMDITSDTAIEAMKVIASKLLNLNILGSDQTKNDLLIAVFCKFDLFDEDDLFIYQTDENGTSKLIGHILDNITWENEINVIVDLIDVYADFTKLDEVNMDTFTINLTRLLDNEDAVTVVVEGLETLIESELVISLITPATNKYLLPITDKYDDDNLVKDIMSTVREKALAEEIIKIVKAFKDAQKLGLFDVPTEGLKALNYQEIDSMKAIIETLFESKIFKGFEGRVIRVVLKATKLLDVEKGLLDNIDFTGEKERLFAFLDSVSGILTDPEFKLTDENGNVNIDLNYLTQPEIFKQLMDGTSIIFGTFEILEDGTFKEVEGSELVAKLLPAVYAKYIQPIIPENFKSLMEILNIEELDSDILVSDVRRLVYIANQLVEMDIQTILVGESIVFTDKLEYIDNIIDALLDIQMFKSNGNEVFAWTINYLVDTLAKDFGIEKVSASDFANVNWQNEAATLKRVIENLISFLIENNLSSTDKLKNFINSKKYSDTSFVTTDNANKILDIISEVLNSQTVEVLLPVVFQVVVNQLVKSDIVDKDYWNHTLTGSMLKDDLQSILSIGDILVNEMNFVESWRAGFKGDIFAIPETSSINEVIDKLFGLNLIKGYEADLIKFAINKFLPQNDIVNVDDFDVNSVTNWKNEVNAYKQIIEVVIEILEFNNFETVGQIIDFIDEYKQNSKKLNDYITNKNIAYVASLLKVVNKSDLLTSVLPAGFDYALSIAEKKDFDLNFLQDLTKAELREDVDLIANIIDVLATEGVACLIVKNELQLNDKNLINTLTNVQTIVNYIRKLNLVTKHENTLMAYLVTKGFELAKLTDFTLEASDFQNANWDVDFDAIINVLSILQEVLITNNLVKYREAKEYYDSVVADFKVALTNENALYVVNILQELATMNIVKALLPQALNYGTDKLKELNFNVEFLKDAELTNEELASDIITLSYILIDLIDLNVIDIYKNVPVSHLNESSLRDIPERMLNLNILGKYSSDWMAFIIDYVFSNFVKLNGFNAEYTEKDFNELNAETYASDAKSLGNALVYLSNSLDILFADGYTIEIIKDFINAKQYKNESKLTDDLIDNVFAALSSLVEINALEILVNDFVDFGIDKVSEKSIDISFIKDSCTNQNLASDLIIVGSMAKEAIKFGAVKLLNNENIEHFNLFRINNIIALLEEMNIYTLNRSEIWTLILNKGFELAKVDIKVEATDFNFMSETDWLNDNEQLQLVISSLQSLLNDTNKLATSDDVKSFINNKLYADKDYLYSHATNYNVSILANTLSQVFKLNAVDAVLSDLVDYGFNKLNENEKIKVYDFEFVKELITKEQLSNDIIYIGQIINAAINFGAVEYLQTKEIADIDVVLLYPAIDALGNIELFASQREEWMNLIAHVLTNVLKLNVDYEAEDFAIISDDDVNATIISLKQLLSEISTLLDLWKLNSLTEVLSFVNNSGYKYYNNLSNDVAKQITTIISVIADIQPLYGLLPKLVEYGTKVLKDKVDLTFIDQYIEFGMLTKESLAEDIKTIASIANDAIDFGALSIYFGEYKNNEFEIKFEYISSIIRKLSDIHTLEVCYNKWLNLALNYALKSLNTELFKPSDFEYMLDEMWQEDFENLASAVDNVGDILYNNHLTTYQDIMKFIEQKGYLSANYVNKENVNAVLDLVENIASLNLISPIYETVILFVLDNYVLTKNGDLYFVEDIIENGEYTGSDVCDDIYVIIDMIRTALDFGAIEIFYDKKLENIDVEPLKEIVLLIDELKIFHACEDNWYQYGMNTIIKLLKMDTSEYNVALNEFASFDKNQYSADINRIADIIVLLGKVLTLNYLQSSEDVLNFVNGKAYLTAQFINEDNVDLIVEVLRIVSKMSTISPVVDDLVAYAVSKVSSNKVDLEFVINQIKGKELTGQMILDDLNVIANIVCELVDFGAIDYYYYQSIETLDLSYISKALDELRNLNTLKGSPSQWCSLILNYILNALGVESRVYASDYSDFSVDDWSKSLDNLISVVNQLANLLDENYITSTKEIKEFMSNQYWKLAQYSNDENAKLVLEIINTFADIRSLQPALPAFAKYGISKVGNKVDLSFLNKHMYTELTGELLASDIHTIVLMIDDIINFGVFELIYTKDIKDLDLTKLANALQRLDVLNLYQVDKESWLVLGLNEILKAMKFDDRVTINDFAGLNADAEVDHLVNIINKLDELLTAINVESLSGLRQFIADKSYFNTQYVNHETLDICVDILDELSLMKSMEVVLPLLASWGISKINNEDLSFLVDALKNKEFTTYELIADLRTIVDIAVIGIDIELFDAFFDIVIKKIDGDKIAEMISKLDEINLFTRLRSNWVALLVNKTLGKLNISVSSVDFEHITESEWLQDNVYLQNAAKAVCDILNELGLTYKSAISRFLRNKDFLSEVVIVDSIIDNFNVALTQILSTKTVDVVFGKLLHYVVEKADEKGFDISFIENNYKALDLVNDLTPLIEIAKNLIKFGIKELVEKNEISNIDVTYIEKSVAQLENIKLFTLFRPEWLTAVFNKLFTTMKLDVTLDASCFNLNETEWQEDNLLLQELVQIIGKILKNNNLTIYSDAVNFIKDKKLLLEETYTDENLNSFADVLKNLLSYHVVDAIFPHIIPALTEKVANKGIDLSFLNTTLTPSILKADVDTFKLMFKPLCKFGLFELINNKKVEFLNVEYLKPVVELIPSLGLYQISPENWAASLINFVAEKAKLTSMEKVQASDLQHIDWTYENKLFLELMTLVDKFLINTDLISVENMKALIDNKFKIQSKYAKGKYATYLVDVLNGLVELQSFEAITKNFTYGVLVKLNELQNVDYSYLVDGLTNAQVYSDVKALLSASKELIEFGTVEIVLTNDDIDYTKKQSLYNALEKILKLNVFVGHETQFINSTLEKIGASSSLAEGTVNFANEYPQIITILDNLIILLESYDLYNLNDIKYYNFKETKLNVNADLCFVALANILSVLKDDDMFKYVIKPLSAKYLSSSKLTGLADFHNIYSDLSTLSSDLGNLSNVLMDLSSLHVYHFVTGKIDYPFGERAEIVDIINNIFTLNYFNLNNRTGEIVDAIARLTNSDLSSIDGSKINLANDANKIIEMYDYLAQILCRNDFPIKNKDDLSKNTKLSYFFTKSNLTSLINAVESYMDTTIYEETGLAILIVILPVIKVVARDYWDALDMDNYKFANIMHDSDYFTDILNALFDLDIISGLSGNAEVKKLDQASNIIINSLVQLDLLNGHMNDLAELILSDFVYDKKLGNNYVITNGSLDITNVDFVNDLSKLNEVIHLSLSLLLNDGVNNINQLGNYLKGFSYSKFISNDGNLNIVADIIDVLLESDFVTLNIKALYEIFAVPALNNKKALKYFDYTNANAQQMLDDIGILSDIVRCLVQMNISNIMNDGTINYVSSLNPSKTMADVVEELLTLIGQTNYVQIHLDTYIELLSKKLTGFTRITNAHEEIDIVNDLLILAQVYEKLVPYLSSNDFVVKKISDARAIPLKDFLIGANNHIETICDAYDVLATTTIAPYCFPTLVESIKRILPNNFESVVDVIDVDTLTLEQLKHDTVLTSKLIRDLANTNIFDYVLTGDGLIPDSNVYASVVDDLFEFNCIKPNLTSILKELLEYFDVATVDINFDNIDWDADKTLIESATINFLDAIKLNNLNTYKQTVKFIEQLLKGKLQHKVPTLAMKSLIEGAEDLVNTTVAKQTLLSISKKVLTKAKLPTRAQRLESVLKLSKYSKETFIEDVLSLCDILNYVLDSKLYNYFNNKDELIVWTNVYFENIIREISELHLIPNYGQVIVETIGDVLGVDLSSFKSDNIDYASEQDAYVDAWRELVKLLSRPDFVARTMNDIEKAIKNPKDIDWTYFINYEQATMIMGALKALDSTALSGELYAVGLAFVANTKLVIAKYCNAQNLTRNERIEDYVTICDIAQSVLDFVYNNGKFKRNGKDTSLKNIPAFENVIDKFMELHLFEGQYAEMIEYVLENLHFNTSEMNLDSINYYAEAEYIKQIGVEILKALDEYGIVTLKGFVNVTKEHLDAYTTSNKEFLKKLEKTLRIIGLEHFVNIIELIDSSILLDEIVLPIYNQLLDKYPSLLGQFTKYASLQGYSKDALASDTHLIAQAIRTLFESKFYKAYSEKAILTDEQLELVSDAIKLLGKLEILELKKADIVDFIDSIVKADLSSINFANVNIEHDFDIIANMVPAVYKVYRNTNNFRFTISSFGNTELMNTLIDILEAYFATNISDEITPWFINYLLSSVNKTISMSDTQVNNLCDDVVVALRALSQMGAFSNNGIDFTNKALTDKVFNVFDNFKFDQKTQAIINQFRRNMYELGVLPVDYSEANTKDEFNAYKNFMTKLNSFVNTYKNALTSKDFSIVSDLAFQNDITNLVSLATESKLVDQIFMPLITFISKVCTEKYGKIAICDGMNSEEFVNTALPDLFTMVSYAEQIGLFAGKVDYKQTDAIINLAELLTISSLTKDLLNDLMPMVLKAMLNVNVTKEELVAENIDYVHEVACFKDFLNTIKPQLDNISSDVNTLLAKDFLLAFAKAGRNLETSKLTKMFIKQTLKSTIKQISSTTNVLDFMLEALEDPNYTDELAMEDFMSILNIVEQAAYIDFFQSSINYKALDQHIDVLLINLFGMHAVEGHEEQVMRMILDKLTFVDSSSIDLTTISNWDEEFNSFVDVANALAKLCAIDEFDINNITMQTFENADVQDKFVAFVDAASQAYVSRELFKELFKTTVEPNLPSDAQGIIDLETLPTNDWAAEFEKLFDIYVVINKGLENVSADDIITVYNIMFGLDGNDGLVQVKANYNKWLVKLLDKANLNVTTDGFGIRTDRIPTNNEEAYEEVIKVKAILVDFANYLDSENEKLADLSYAKIISSNDYHKFATTLINISKSLAMRELLLGLIGDSLLNSTDESGNSTLKVKSLGSNEFWVQYYDSSKFDVDFWNELNITTFAIFVVTANVLDLGTAGNFDIFTMDLGANYPDVDSYNNVAYGNPASTVEFPSQLNGANNVGLKQILQLMNASNIFDLTSLAHYTDSSNVDHNGIIEDALINANIINPTKSNYRPLGIPGSTYDEWNTEIKALINAFDALKAKGLLIKNGTYNQNIANEIANMSKDEIVGLLETMNQSEMLRPIIAEVLYDALSITLVNSGVSTETSVSGDIEHYVPQLAELNQNTSMTIGTKGDVSNLINTVALMIEQVRTW